MDRLSMEGSVSRWSLPAPETAMLLWGYSAGGDKVLKAALRQLVADKVLHLTVLHRYFDNMKRSRKEVYLTRGPRIGAALPASLDPVRSLYYATPESISTFGEVAGVSIRDLVKETNNRYGDLKRFARAEVWPHLVEGDVYESAHRTFLGIFPVVRWELTPKGQVLKGELTRLMDAGKRQFAGWTETDLRRAVTFLASVGPALFIMEKVFPHLNTLYRAGLGTGGTSVTTWGSLIGGDLFHQEEHSGVTETMSEFLNDIFSFSFSDLGSLGDSFDAVDAGVGSGDTGSDGGGGDGGGDGDGD